ncbi:uncharacterized protein ZBAI_01790 [Zygosaccharomyces bailii ISA1307]|nr:uncharacterized protein ZBAI_01790 [Zygosaccharomyces bailii ISA1307]
MDPESYKIGWFFEGKLIKTYCEDVLSRMLAQKAIANYRKNYPEEFDDLSEIDSNNDRSDRLFEKLYRIIMAIVLGMVLIEFATIFILGLASIIACIYYEEFDDLSEIDSNNDRSDRLFEKLHRIIMAIVLGMVLIEFATIFILGLASIIVCIYYAISNASSSPNFK